MTKTKYVSKFVTPDTPRVAFLPGLEATQGVANRTTTSSQVYAKHVIPEEVHGWTTVKRGGKRKQRRAADTDYYIY